MASSRQPTAALEKHDFTCLDCSHAALFARVLETQRLAIVIGTRVRYSCQEGLLHARDVLKAAKSESVVSLQPLRRHLVSTRMHPLMPSHSATQTLPQDSVGTVAPAVAALSSLGRCVCVM